MDEQKPADRIRAEAKEAARRAFLEAGLVEMIALGGVEVPTINAVCERTGYTRGAFYFYFEDSEHFFGEMLEWLLRETFEPLFARAVETSTSMSELVGRFTDALARREWPTLHGDARAAYLSIMRGVSADETLRQRHAESMTALVDRLADTVREGQERGELRGDTGARHVAMLFVLMAAGAVLWDDVEIPVDPTGLRDTVLTFLEPEPPR